MTPGLVVAVAMGGGVGAVARFVTDGAIARRFPARWPVGTLTINVLGSFLLGVIVGATLDAPAGSTTAAVRSVLGVGFCGGFTTFSTASCEAVRLAVGKGWRDGVGYALVTLLASVAAASLGMVVAAVV